MQSIDPAVNLTAVTGGSVAPPVQLPRQLTPPDRVAKAAPDAERGEKRTADVAAFGNDSFAVYSVDEKTHVTRIAIYDGEGRLLRMIPPESVQDMLSQLAAYRRLR